MSKNTVSKISNAFSTGGGGVNFEQQIQAMFLLSMLIDGFCPAMNERTKRVCFQAKHLGYDVDDLVVFTYRNQSEGKLLCQVKHSITVSEKDKTFHEVICAAWSDFNKENFDKENDRIALATAQIAYKSQQALKFLHAAAIGSVDENEFIEKVNLPAFSNSDNPKMLTALENCITAANRSKPTSSELWKFCRIFILLLFDLDCAESVNRALSSSLIKCNSSTDALLVWSRLVEYASNCNQTAASVDLTNIDKNILELFSARKVIQLPPTPITEIDLFIPAIALIGAWNEENDFDRQIVEKIAGIDYAQFEARTRNMISQDSEYLQLINGAWKVLHKEELLDQCKNLLFDDCLERLLEAAQVVFTQKSKRVTSQAPYYIASTGEYDNSNEIRKSLASSLCWVKKALPDLSMCNHDKLEGSLIRLVRTLLEDGEWTTWASLGDCLQNIAEIAPEVFLERVEWSVLHKPQGILRLFPQKNGSLFGQENYISELLWAIEILAWSPDYLIPSICALGLLEAMPYEKTNWANTPINSIVSILLPWYPQTIADIEKRKDALRCLSKDNPTVFWLVLTKLLPNQTSVTSGNPKPKYLSLEIPEEIKVTRKELYEQYSFNMALAVEVSQNEIEKLAFLATQIEYMNEETLIKFLDCIDRNCQSVDEKERFVLWLNLRESIASIRPTEETVVYKQIDRIQMLIERIKPHNICLTYQVLYLGKRYLFDKGDYSTVWEMLEQKKVLAVKEIFDKFGIVETERFGHSVKNLHDVADKLGRSLMQDEISTIIDTYDSGKLSLEFFIPCITAFSFKQGPEKLMETSLCQKDSEFILGILSKIPFTQELLKVVNQLLPDDSSYWESAIMPYCCKENERGELKLIVDKLTECKRYVTAINIVGRSDFQGIIDAESIYKLLRLAGTEESFGTETIDNYAVQKVIGWFQQQDDIALELRSDIDFIYLPVLDRYSETQPRALNTRLSMDPDYFCGLLELFYKKHSEEKHKIELNEGMKERLFEVLFQFKVTPGINWNGEFEEEQFRIWINSVKSWSIENDRYVAAMHTVGSGLSYSKLDDEKLPPIAIIEELNKVDNDELRRGYYLGVINQRGVHFVDPEGKPELELGFDYENRANLVETKGYSRYAGVLREIADQYHREASQNILSAQLEDES